MGLKVMDPDNVLPELTRLELDQFANRVLDYSVLTGTTPRGAAPRPRPDLSAPGKQFVANLVELRTTLANTPNERRRQVIYARLMVEVLDDLLTTLKFHGIDVDEFAALGLESGYDGYIRFLEDLPSVRVNAHLYTQWLQNPRLPVREAISTIGITSGPPSPIVTSW